MDKAGFLDRIGRENVCAHIDAALDRAREILGLPPAPPTDPHYEEKQKLEAARRELASAIERVQDVAQAGKQTTIVVNGESQYCRLWQRKLDGRFISKWAWPRCA